MQKSYKVSSKIRSRISRFLQNQKWTLSANLPSYLLFKNSDNTTIHLYTNGRILLQGKSAELIRDQLFISYQFQHKIKKLIHDLTDLVQYRPIKWSDHWQPSNFSAIKTGLQDFYMNFYDRKHLMTFFPGPWEELEWSEKVLRGTAQTLKIWINNVNGIRHEGNFSLALLGPGILTCLQILIRDYQI